MQIEQNVQAPASSFMSKLMKRYGAIGGKLGLAIMDQGLFAGSNFLVNVLLARWMLPDEYGAYAVGFAWFLVAQNLYEALVTEPMAIYGAGKYSKQTKRYFGAAFLFHIWFSLLVAVPFFAGASLMQQSSPLVGISLFATALLMPALLARWLFRQPFYVISNIRPAVIGSVIYLVLVLAATVIFHLIPVTESHLTLFVMEQASSQSVFWIVDASLLNPFTAVAANGIAGGITALIMTFFFVKPDFRSSAEVHHREVYTTHLKYGRWSSVEHLMMWFRSNIFYLVIPIMYDLSVSGALRALSNIEMPVYLTLTAIGAVTLPAFVRTYNNDGYNALMRRVQKIRIMVMALTGGMAVIFIVGGQWIVNMLYDGRYDTYTTMPILISMAAQLVLFGLTAPLDLSLRARGLIKHNFVARLLPNLLVVTLGMFIVVEYGLLGAKIAMAVTTFVHLLVLLYLHRKVAKGQSAQSAATVPVPVGD